MTSVDEMRRARRRRLERAAKHRRILRRSRGISTSMLPAAPVREHVRALMALHWNASVIAAWARVGTKTSILRIAHGEQGSVEPKFAALQRIPLTLAPPPWIPDHAFVPCLGARRRIHALYALGWPLAELDRRAGATLQHTASGAHVVITARNWRRIAAVYDALSGTPGPNQLTRDRAVARGCRPPLAWHDIDDPRERPSGVRRPSHSGPGHDDVDESVVDRILAGDWRLSATRAERRAVVARWLAAGRGPLNDLERRTGWRFDRYLEQDEQEAS